MGRRISSNISEVEIAGHDTGVMFPRNTRNLVIGCRTHSKVIHVTSGVTGVMEQSDH